MRLFFATLMFINSLFLISATPIKNTPDKLIQNLDSTVTFNPIYERLSKESFSYSADDEICTKMEGFYLGADKWVKSYETEFGYDTNKNKISELGSTLDDVSNSLKPTYKYTWTYDNLGNYENEEYFTKEITDADFTGLTKSVYTYNSDATIAQVMFYIWGQGGIWAEHEKYIYGYDLNGNQTTQEIYAKNLSTSDWEKKIKQVKEFDGNKNLLIEEYYKGDNYTNSWTKITKTTYTYSGSILQVKLVESGNSSNLWVNTSKYTYVYSGANVASINETTWENNLWVDHSKEVYTYVSGEVSKIESSLWNQTTSTWNPYFEKVYIYNANGVSEELYSFDQEGQKFGVKKWAQKDDLNGNPLLKESSAWVNGKWELISKENSAYDPSSNLITYAKYNNEGGYYKSDFEYTSNARPLLNTAYVWDNTLKSWDKDLYTKFYYRDLVTIIETADDNTIQIWTSFNKIIIESEHLVSLVNVYSMEGKQIYNGKESEINTHDWSKSAYIVNVVTEGGQRKSAKIIIQ